MSARRYTSIMDVLEALKSRRTIRQYDSAYSIPKDVLDQLVEIALDSPTARDLQGVDLVVVTNRAKINELTTIAFDSWEDERKQFWNQRVETYGVKNVVSCDAGCLIFFVSNGKAGNFLDVDVGIMTMALMAGCRAFDLHSMCLGAVLSGNKPGLESAVGVPEGSLVMCLAIGKCVVDKPVLKEKARTCKATFIE